MLWLHNICNQNLSADGLAVSHVLRGRVRYLRVSGVSFILLFHLKNRPELFVKYADKLIVCCHLLSRVVHESLRSLSLTRKAEGSFANIRYIK